MAQLLNHELAKRMQSTLRLFKIVLVKQFCAAAYQRFEIPFSFDSSLCCHIWGHVLEHIHQGSSKVMMAFDHPRVAETNFCAKYFYAERTASLHKPLFLVAL